jgi:2,5-diketo-D-gluconate reductase A
MSEIPGVTLNNGVEIPQLGFGVFQIPPRDTREATLSALEAGYRHIDTAEAYGNEKEVGQAVRDSGIDRQDVFVTSKLTGSAHARDDALRAFEGTLRALDLGHLDLFLIHWPRPGVDLVETWLAMEEMYRSGRVRAVGVSNFEPHHLRRVIEGGVIVPSVNQIELHPYRTQDTLRAFDTDHEIATEAYSPIAQGAVLDDPVITGIARRVGRSAAQVTLRWHLQRGEIIIPKSVRRARMEENLNLFDFELTEGDVAEITALNRK